MPILLADSNSLQKPALLDYLQTSRSNRIALAEEVLIEMHKCDPAFTVAKCLEQARRFPQQVVVLKGVTSIYGTPIRNAAEARTIIDLRQTRNFAQWYDDVLDARDKSQMDEYLQGAHAQAKAQIDEIAASVQHIQPIFRKVKKRFDSDELKQMRNLEPLSKSAHEKLIHIMYGISRVLFVKTGVPERRYPRLNEHAFRYFVFRYAMCITLLYTRWVHHGNLSDDTDKLVNHIMDMHISALGTFFGGVLSDDQMLIDVHREARRLLRYSQRAYVG